MAEKPHLEDLPEDQIQKMEADFEKKAEQVATGEVPVPMSPILGARAQGEVVQQCTTQMSLNLDDEKYAMLMQLKTEIDKEDLSPVLRKWANERCMCRYLRARQWNFQKAKTMLLGTLKWRAENNIDALRAKTVESQIRMGHMYNMVRDKLGRPVMILRVHTEKDPHTREEKLNFMIYCMERAIRTMPPNVEQWVWLVSCKDYNYKYNGEVRFAQQLLSVLQNHYPERLGLLVVSDPPFMFKVFWKMIYPFVDENTAKKMVFLGGPNDPSGEKYKTLEQLMDMSTVEATFAGTSPYKFDPDEYMKILQDEEQYW